MPAWMDGSIQNGRIKIHYYRSGGDKPPVVINHGAGDDGLCWTRVAMELEKEYDVILPDARGHGKSSSGKGDYSTARRVEDLVALIEGLKLDRPVVGGHSMGADTSMYLAARNPDLVRGLFLEDPPIFMPGEKFTAGDQVIEMKDIGKMMAKYMRIIKLLPGFISVRMARKANPTYPDCEILPWVKAKQRVSFDFLSSMGTMGLGAPNPFEVFTYIQAPTLLFIGDREKMALVSQEAAQEVVKANPGICVIHLAGASHDIRRTRFDGYLPALKKFLAEV